jgi:hypothetical protein
MNFRSLALIARSGFLTYVWILRPVGWFGVATLGWCRGGSHPIASGPSSQVGERTPIWIKLVVSPAWGGKRTFIPGTSPSDRAQMGLTNFNPTRPAQAHLTSANRVPRSSCFNSINSPASNCISVLNWQPSREISVTITLHDVPPLRQATASRQAFRRSSLSAVQSTSRTDVPYKINAPCARVQGHGEGQLPRACRF